MTEAELHLIRSRLRGGLQQGERGRAALQLPAGWSATRTADRARRG